jgi:uroporphyrin-III C-methyltransferase
MPFDQSLSNSGQVFLVGAGPGDPELLTIKALRVIESCDVIFYDALVSEEIKALFPRSARAIYVGKRCSDHSVTQEALCELLVAEASNGLKICRLKGGDPFVFGRGSEEALALSKAGIEWHLVPGITAAIGCAASAGIPLTHRGIAQGCTFVTAHARCEKGQEKALEIDWKSLVNSKNTLVFYMGLGRADLIQSKLIAAGMPSSMEIAIIEKGCTSEQKFYSGELSHLFAMVSENDISAPALIVVGKVVAVAKELAQFKNLNIFQQQQSLV